MRNDLFKNRGVRMRAPINVGAELASARVMGGITADRALTAVGAELASAPGGGVGTADRASTDVGAELASARVQGHVPADRALTDGRASTAVGAELASARVMGVGGSTVVPSAVGAELASARVMGDVTADRALTVVGAELASAPGGGRATARLGLVTAGLLALLLSACGGGAEGPAGAPQPEPVAVQTAVAAYEPVPEIVEASGGVEPWRQVSPGTKILGRVDSVPVREGDRVEKGQLLALLERRDLQAAVAQAEAAVAMAEAQLENARAQHRRMASLHAKGSVTDKNLEDATAGFRVAQAGLEQARANLAAARVTLGYAEVRSPVAGWLTARRVEAGDMAGPGQPLFTVEDLSKVKVTVEVPETQLAGLAPGDPAMVVVDVLGEERPAQVDSVIPAGDPASRTFQVRLVLDNPDGRIKSGMFARARFGRGSREALAVPAGAVVERGQLRGLFVVEEGGEGAEGDRARLRWVKLGRTLDGRVEVLSGLEAGERYVLAPGAGLVDGAPVRAQGASRSSLRPEGGEAS